MADVEDWRDKFLPGGAENALRSRAQNEAALRDPENKQLKQTDGELALDLDILKTTVRVRPTEPGTPEP